MLTPPKMEASTLAPIPFEKCPAKTQMDFEGQIVTGQSVLTHSRIVGYVAREIIRRLPRFLVSTLFPPGSALVAALHDMGKISPTFVSKIGQSLTDQPNEFNLSKNGVDSNLERQWGGHPGVSLASAKHLGLGNYISFILGQHHGYTPNLGGKTGEADVFGGPAWQAERKQLAERLKGDFGAECPDINSEEQAYALAGLTCVADWIGSGPAFDDPEADWLVNIKSAVTRAGFIRPRLKSGLSFEDIFGFSPWDIQAKLVRAVDKPGLYVLEAPMGLGKTEAALYAAYRMMERDLATGIYFALPTQLTSDKIHERVNAFLNRILDSGSPHNQALLLHGLAWLRHTELGADGGVGQSWFDNTKRSILAPFGVGTVDQALMAVMNVKHGFVRTFGLAGKVVILDEVHTYDAYTGTILDQLVNALRKLQCTVIILSATLSGHRRQKLTGVSPDSQAYPLVSASPGEELLCREIPGQPPKDQSVSLTLTLDSDAALREALKRAEQGEQVLWLENTVAQAQDSFRLLAARSPEVNVDCGLLHSRFTRSHRKALEEQWVGLFGKGNRQRNQQGRILVGTQVLEQSLDIDADFLISRFCPTDMLLQRLGRLWRHDQTNRPASARREAWFIAPGVEEALEDPIRHFGATAFVYSPYVLCRSLEVWQGRKSVRLPADIRPLIEATYSPRGEQGPMLRWLDELENGSRRRIGRQALKNLALNSLTQIGRTLPERKAQTRYSEQETVQVLMLRRVDCLAESTVPTLADGKSITLPAAWSIPIAERKGLSAALMTSMVNIPVTDAPPKVLLTSLQWLKGYLYLGQPEDRESVLRVVVVAADGRVRPYGKPPGELTKMTYDARLGFGVSG